MLTAIAVRSDALDYSCSNCVAPACICPSTQPPGGLPPSDTPQMILITFDDAVYGSRYDIIQQVVTNHWNPNGTPIQATFYINTDWCDYRQVQQLHAQGHEIAIHTMTHTTGTNTDVATWRREIYGARKTLSDLAQIPIEEIVGFRAPHLKFNHASFQALADAGMEYDASVKERPGTLSPDGTNYIWPYTLDNGLAQIATTGVAPTNPFPGLFEVPIWVLLNSNGAEECTMDCSGTPEEFLALLQRNFLERYNGNRAPLGIFLHTYWFTNQPQNVGAINDFIAWAQTYTNVWFVSTHALVQYMKNPVDAASATSFPPFVTAVKSICPDEELTTCAYSMDTFRTCGECPPAYPKPDTVFTDPLVTTDGVAWIEITEQYANSYGAHLGVSNNTDRPMADWVVQFDIPQGYLHSLWNGHYETNGNTVIVRPSGNQRPIQAGEVQTDIGFWVSDTGGNTQVSNFTVRLIDLTPKRPTIDETRSDEHGRVAMRWGNDAPGYRLMFTTNTDFTGWQPWCEIYGKTSHVATIPAEIQSGFFRLQALPKGRHSEDGDD
jgi:peptidoglycan/xylan/chitin deacetylase (PgdA/CDA1 family)